MGILNIFGKRSAEPLQERTEPTMKRPALSRHGHRSLYAAASSDRLNASWGSTPMTADQIIMRNQRALVARSREQCANNDYARGFLRMVRQNVVGPNGPVLQAGATLANGKLDQGANDAIEAGWREWGQAGNCDVTGKRSWRGIVQGCLNTAGKDGEFFVRLVFGRDAGPWGFALQTIDPQRCPPDMNEPARNDGSFIRHGIRFNRYGRPLGYYFTALTQSDENYWYGGRAHVYVPAAEIIHGFIEDIEGQKRGLPWMATGLFRLKNLNGFEDATIINARIGASKMGFIQWKDGYGPELEDEEEMPEITAEPGVFETLPEGAEMKEWNPQFPSGDVGPFAKHLLRGFSAGTGGPYNELAHDLEGVNFSSIRQGTLDSREYWKELQEWLIETLCQRVFEAWLPIALLSGRLTNKGRALNASKLDKYSVVKWQARRWDWIDPRADTQSAVDRKNNFLASPSAIIRDQGKDPEGVWKETARDMRAMKESLIAEGFSEEKAEELVLLSMGRQPPKTEPAKGKPNETEPTE